MRDVPDSIHGTPALSLPKEWGIFFIHTYPFIFIFPAPRSDFSLSLSDIIRKI